MVLAFHKPCGGIKGGGHTFPKGISLEVNVIALLEFELAYYKAAVQPYVDIKHRISKPIVCSWHFTQTRAHLFAHSKMVSSIANTNNSI